MRHRNVGILANFINLKHENMTWYDTYEEIKTKYPDTVFEEYWLTKDDNDDPVIIIKQKGI